jgi:hypothetical protein
MILFDIFLFAGMCWWHFSWVVVVYVSTGGVRIASQNRHEMVARHFGREAEAARFDLLSPRLMEKLNSHIRFHRTRRVIENSNVRFFFS